MMSSKKVFLKMQVVKRSWSAFAPENIFHQDNIRKTVENFSKIQPVKASTKLPTRNAAVLVPLCVVDGQVSLLYTLRAPSLKSHKGQVSFPGGMEDAEDTGAEQTAIRETHEELGVGLEQIEVWGKGNVIVNRSSTSVLPVIGVLNFKNLKSLNVNPHEVEEVFTVPLQTLCHPDSIKHTQFRGQHSMPVYFGGKKKIWGLTAIITHFFLKSLLPKECYNPPIKYIPPLKGNRPFLYT